MPSPLLRSVIAAVTRRTHYVKCTSLTPAAINLHSKSLSTLAPPSYYKSGGDVWLFQGTGANLGLNGDENNIASKSTINIKSSIVSMMTNLTGDGALVTLGAYQLDNTEENYPDVRNNASAASLMYMASSAIEELSIWLISTLKRRKKMMNKHKLRKRRKKLRLKSKK